MLESEDASSDVPSVSGTLVIGMANSILVIHLGVSSTGGGMLIVALLLVNVGAMVQSWLLYLASLLFMVQLVIVLCEPVFCGPEEAWRSGASKKNP